MSELITLSEVGRILSNIGNKLIQCKDILKLINYNTPDALSQSDVSLQDIIKLVGKGSNPKSEQKIFKTPFNDNIVDDVRSEIRFFTPLLKPNNIYISEVIISFQIIVHNSIWDLEENQRPLVLLHEILKNFNGYDIGSIGELQLSDSIRIFNWNNSFAGYQVNFKTRTQ